MNLEQYAAQNAQAPQGAQNAPQTQEALPVDLLAATMDAERLYSLMAEAQEAIEGATSPAALLTAITGAMFGDSSPQAAAVEAIIEADRHPGGHEMAIAGLRQRRKLLKQQQKQLEAQTKAIAEELTALDAAEQALTHEKAEAAALDRALVDTLTLCKQLDAAPQPDMLKDLTALYDRHRSKPAAMGLLYGCITELARKGYSAGTLDLIQQQEFTRLQERVAEAMKG